VALHHFGGHCGGDGGRAKREKHLDKEVLRQLAEVMFVQEYVHAAGERVGQIRAHAARHAVLGGTAPQRAGLVFHTKNNQADVDGAQVRCEKIGSADIFLMEDMISEQPKKKDKIKKQKQGKTTRGTCLIEYGSASLEKTTDVATPNTKMNRKNDAITPSGSCCRMRLSPFGA
jgi:hypothetical protein